MRIFANETHPALFETIDISNNFFESLEIENARSLISLKAQYNKLSNVSIIRADSLRSIDLSHNEIRAFPPFFQVNNSATPVLTIALLSHNKIRKINENVTLNNQIMYLDLSYNLLTETYQFQFLADLREKDDLTPYYHALVKCVCPENADILEDPSRRVFNLIANRITESKSAVITAFNGYGTNLWNQTAMSKIYCDRFEHSRRCNFVAAEKSYIFDITPQDVDECALNTHKCEQKCIDGWNPVLDHTCGCRKG